MTTNSPKLERPSTWTTVAVCLGLVLLFGLLDRLDRGKPGRDEPLITRSPAAEAPNSSTKTVRQRDADVDRVLVIRNVRILDEQRRVVYQGDVDLAPTLARIEQGVRLRFPHDGAVFENRERRLPIKPRANTITNSSTPLPATTAPARSAWCSATTAKFFTRPTITVRFAGCASHEGPSTARIRICQ